MILRGVLEVLGGWRLEVVQLRLVHRRFSLAFAGIARLLARHRAGRLRPVSGGRSARPVTADDDPNSAMGCVAGRGPALPRRFGWLVRAGGYQAAGFGSQLQAVLTEPEMVALLTECPQAVRLLRPLCRALAIELDWVKGAARGSAERVVRPRVTRVRVKPEPFRIPLPRGVISAARRAGFGKRC